MKRGSRVAGLVVALLCAALAIWIASKRERAPALRAGGDAISAAAAKDDATRSGSVPGSARSPAAPAPQAAEAPEQPEVAHALRVVVLEADGATPAKAALLLARDGVVEEGEVLDERGVFETAARDHTVEAWVVAGDVLRARSALGAGAGEHVIVLAGEVARGTLWIEGAPPARPVTFHWYPLTGVEPLPAAATEFLGWTSRPYSPSFACTTDPGGAFALEALPPAWRVVVELPEDLRSASGGSSIEVGHEDELVLRAFPRAGVRGRIVGSTGEPEAGALVRAELACADGEVVIERTSDAGGAFFVPVACLPPAEGVLRAAGAEGRSSALVRVALDGERAIDVGDVALLVRAPLALEVVDDAGAPVAEALVLAPPLPSARTDARGRAAIAAPPDLAPLAVHAWNHAPAIVRVAGAGAVADGEPIRVVLRRGHGLFVRTHGVSDEMREALSLIVAARSDDAFEGFVTEPGSWQDALGVGHDGPWRRARYPALAEVGIPGLRPGATVDLEVRDVAGVTLARASATALAPGTTDVDLSVEAPLCAARVRVADERGAPLRGALVTIGGGSYMTDAGGVVTLRALSGGPIEVEAHAQGKAPRGLAIARPCDGEVHEVRLARERRIAIRVEGPSGEPAPPWALWAEAFAAGEAVGSHTKVAHGELELFALPPGRVLVRVKAAGLELERWNDGEPRMTFTLPPFGSLRAVAERVDLEAWYQVELAPLETDRAPRRFGASGADLRRGKVDPLTYAGEYRVRLIERDAAGVERELASTRVTVEPGARADVTL